MNGKTIVILCAVAVATILLFTVVIQEVKGSPAPKKGGKGGGGKGGGSRSSGGSRTGGGGYKKSGGGGLKSFGKKHWKKAVAFGAGAYVAKKVSLNSCEANNSQTFHFYHLLNFF